MNYSLSRRHFIHIILAIALAQSTSGCANGSTGSQILFLENSIPPQLIRSFLRQFNSQIKLDFKPQTQITQIFDSLINLNQNKNSEQKTKNLLQRIFNKSITSPVLTTLGDVWLAEAIKQKLVTPLSIKDSGNWRKLSPTWHQLVRRNDQGAISAEGQIYAAPYRWGGTVIAVRNDKLAAKNITIQDWSDLWQPQLRNRLSLLDNSREVIGLTLKKLGYSYNLDDLGQVRELESELQALHQQAKLYSSDHYLEPLVLGDTWAAVGWSTDVLAIQERYPEIKVIIPPAGTALWADLWVKPQMLTQQESESQDNTADPISGWIDYCWSAQAAKQISLFTHGLSPALPAADVPASLQDNPFVDLSISDDGNHEFLAPLNEATNQQYQNLWRKIRA